MLFVPVFKLKSLITVWTQQMLRAMMLRAMLLRADIPVSTVGELYHQHQTVLKVFYLLMVYLLMIF